jgi:syntaxin-binding protein 5
VSVDSKNEVIVWSLQQAKKIASYSPPGAVSSLVTDHGLDWAFIGLSSGEVIAYDLDRERVAPLRLPNFWRERNPRARILSAVCMQLHPKDIGQLLIGYTEGAVIYSFKQNKPLQYFRYEIPPGAPGGNSDPSVDGKSRYPRLTQALWHPSGTFVATAYDDSSLVFWDIKEARILMARTLLDTNVDKPGGSFGKPGTLSLNEKYTRIAWCAKENPDDTGILVAGGQSMSMPSRGLTFLELGPTPIYATSSWQVLSGHFQGKRQHLLPTPPGAEVVDFCLIPRTSPHFAGAQDPIAVIAVLSSGELITLTFPSGHPISPTNQLHPSLAFVHPFVTSIAVSGIDRERWLGMTETRQQGPPIMRGGAEAKRALRRYEARNIIQMAHGDGTVRIFDAGHADELENSSTLQVDIARALARYEDVDISTMSMAGATGELAVGTRAGEVVIYRWGGNRLYGREAPRPTETKQGGITDISERTEPALKLGLQPFALYDMAQGSISALKVSDVGFIGVGSENGFFSILDLRGPAVIFSISMADFGKQIQRRGSLIKRVSSSGQTPANAEWPVVVEFGVMTAEGDDYSSILCFVGTSIGRVVTLKILPQGNGRYTAKMAGSTMLDGGVVAICPISSTSGKPALATGTAVAGLREGQQVHGALVVGMSSFITKFSYLLLSLLTLLLLSYGI